VVSIFSKAVSVIRIALLVAFSGPVSSNFSAPRTVNIGKLAVTDYRGIGAIVDAFLVIPALFVSIWHFVELAKKPVAVARDLQIVYEVSNVTSYISRISYAVAVNTPDSPPTLPLKVGAAALVGVMNMCCGLLLAGESMSALRITPPTQ